MLGKAHRQLGALAPPAADAPPAEARPLTESVWAQPADWLPGAAHMSSVPIAVAQPVVAQAAVAQPMAYAQPVAQQPMAYAQPVAQQPMAYGAPIVAQPTAHVVQGQLHNVRQCRDCGRGYTPTTRNTAVAQYFRCESCNRSMESAVCAVL